MKGTITRRGKTSWRLKFDVDRDANGKRKIRYVTVRGKRQDAERELSKQLNAFHDGTSVEPSKLTVAEFVRSWLSNADVTPKTAERYQQLAEQQIIPHLGATLLQKLKPSQIQDWHSALMQRGGQGWKAAIGTHDGPCPPRSSSRACSGHNGGDRLTQCRKRGPSAEGRK